MMLMRSASSTATTFAGCGLLPGLADRLADSLGIIHPTNVQRKSLPVVLEGKHAVINAETGSGKTLYLTKLATRNPCAKLPSPYSIVLAPTPHLANQIDAVFSLLAAPEWGSTVVHGGSRMLLKPNTHFLVGTPTCMAQYDILKIFRDVGIVCVDEADVLLTGGEQEATWEILKVVKHLWREDKGKGFAGLENQSERGAVPSKQFIFSAATLPAGGRMTVQSLLRKWLPRNTQFITTQNTHQLVPTAQTIFVDIHDHTPASTCSPAQQQLEQRLSTLYNDLKSLGKQAKWPKVLVFANTIASVRTIYEYLGSRQETSESGEPRNVGVSEAWWEGGRTRQLHKGVPPEEMEQILRQFREGAVRVLVCTDLVSRGLDLPDVSAVIQFDFPRNSADYLHRAGRTARAGREGVVIAYVCDSDRDLANEIRRVLADRTGFAPIFSRNRMLKRKLKARVKRRDGGRS